MTVNSTPSKIIYKGNGATTVFPIPFSYLDPADVKVVITTNDRDTEISAGYTVSGQNLIYPSAGPPLVSGQKITIMRWMDIWQGTQLTNQGSYHPKVVEGSLDERAMIDQQLAEKLDRAIVLPPSYEGDANDSNLALVLLDARDQAVDAAGRAEDAADRAEGAADRAEAASDQIMDLSIAVDDAPYGEVASGSYNAKTGMLTIRVPEGKQGEAGADGRDGNNGRDGKDGIAGSPGLAPVADVIDCGGAANTHLSAIDAGNAASFS